MEIQEEQSDSSNHLHQPLLGAKYVSIERRSPQDTVFMVDDTHFRSAMPQPTHWSIAWSDLMMTMFVLFLSLFVYKTADDDFLSPDRMEVIGGETSAALDGEQFEEAGIPFTPAAPGAPLITGGTVNKTEKVTLQRTAPGNRFPTIKDRPEPEREIVEVPVEKDYPEIPEIVASNIVTGDENTRNRATVIGSDPVQPRPLLPAQQPPSENIQEIYRTSKQTLSVHNLKNFAKIELIPDRTMRITLTSDQLFATGEAELYEESRQKLQQIGLSIQSTPYIINVVGHTDNVPVSSPRFTSNWELSVARASTVARFLIEKTDMNPGQFIVSGYSSYRPLVPNSSAENRKKNRRVEIIISRKLPKPLQADISAID